MPLISTDYRHYLTTDPAPVREHAKRARGPVARSVIRSVTRIFGYFCFAMGLTFIGWGAGFDSAWVPAVLFAYPLTETAEWLMQLLRDRASAARSSV
jgi:hypothetical protein